MQHSPARPFGKVVLDIFRLVSSNSTMVVPLLNTPNSMAMMSRLAEEVC